MGQKTNPIGFRLGVSRQHRSRYYAGRELPAMLKEDELLRTYLKTRLGHAAIADVVIENRGAPEDLLPQVDDAWRWIDAELRHAPP